MPHMTRPQAAVHDKTHNVPIPNCLYPAPRTAPAVGIACRAARRLGLQFTDGTCEAYPSLGMYPCPDPGGCASLTRFLS